MCILNITYYIVYYNNRDLKKYQNKIVNGKNSREFQCYKKNAKSKK